ncbi:MAG: hypothetical protein IJU84_08625 [Clostridia bacterium]|nr:hypothetical protein [Clostridia bacterium]
MKKLTVLIVVSLLALSMLLGVAACGDVNWNNGNTLSSETASSTDGEVSAGPSEEEVAHQQAVQNYNLAVESVQSANDGNTVYKTDKDGEYVLDENNEKVVAYNVFTKTSLAAFNAEVADYLELDVETATTDELNAATEAIANAAIETLVTVESVIDARLRNAIAALHLYKEDATGNVIYYRWDDTVDDVVICNATDEGAYTEPDKGVERIDYQDVDGVKTATFVLIEDQLDVLLMKFMETGVLDVFNNDFTDLTKVIFKFDYNDEPYEFEYATNNGMYLAAGLLAVCAGMQEQIVAALEGYDVDINSVVKTMKDKTFDAIKGSECMADLTVSNDEYTYTATFKVVFTDPTVSNTPEQE